MEALGVDCHGTLWRTVLGRRAFSVAGPGLELSPPRSTFISQGVVKLYLHVIYAMLAFYLQLKHFEIGKNDL